MTNAVSQNTALFVHFLRIEAKSYMKTPAAIFWTFFYPILMFFVLFAIFGTASRGRPGLSYADYLISGLAVMTAISASMFGVAAALIEHKANARLLLFEFMPFHKGIFIAGLAASRVIILTIFFLVFIGAFSHLAPTANAVTPLNLLLLVTLLASAALVLVGAGLLMAALIERPGVGYAVSNVINVPIIFLSDLFLPAALFPKWLAAAIQLSPFLALVNTVRAVYAGEYAGITIAATIAALLVVGLAVIALASRLITLRPRMVAT
jgi:ABC-2 type transport system permease protein